LEDPVNGPALETGTEACSAPDEVCVPYKNVTTGQATGAKELADASCPQNSPLGSCENSSAVLDPAQFPPCAPDASCVHQQLIASTGNTDLLSQLAECPDSEGTYCVPNKLIASAGNLIPASCTSVANAEGRCMSKSLPQVAALGDLLPVADCDNNEVCSPCFDPVTGDSSGACNLACDTGPNQDPVVFASCENTGGRCVPMADLPPGQLATLAERDCLANAGANHMCVPNQILQAGPFVLCRGNTVLTVNVRLGSCLNTNILDITGSTLLPEGNILVPAPGNPNALTESATGCADAFGSGFKCVPCEQNGAPTGAPGCPADLSSVPPIL